DRFGGFVEEGLAVALGDCEGVIEVEDDRRDRHTRPLEPASMSVTDESKPVGRPDSVTLHVLLRTTRSAHRRREQRTLGGTRPRTRSTSRPAQRPLTTPLVVVTPDIRPPPRPLPLIQPEYLAFQQ